MDTRQRILETAGRVISETGLARVTTRDITDAAGLAAGTLYVHFPHKEDLFLAIVQSSLPDFIPAVEPEHAGARPLRESLEDVCRAALRYYAALIPLAASLFADPQLLARHQAWMAEHGGPERTYQRVAAYVEAEQRLGRITSDHRPLDVAAALLGPCFQQAFMRHFLGAPPLGRSDEEFVHGSVDTLLEGLAPAA